MTDQEQQDLSNLLTTIVTDVASLKKRVKNIEKFLKAQIQAGASEQTSASEPEPAPESTTDVKIRKKRKTKEEPAQVTLKEEPAQSSQASQEPAQSSQASQETEAELSLNVIECAKHIAELCDMQTLHETLDTIVPIGKFTQGVSINGTRYSKDDVKQIALLLKQDKPKTYEALAKCVSTIGSDDQLSFALILSVAGLYAYRSHLSN